MAKKSRNKKKNKKYFLGGIDPINLGVGAVTTGINIVAQQQAKKDAENSANVRKMLARNEQAEIDSNFLKEYDSQGTGNAQYYAKGGSYNLNVRTIGNKKNFKPMGDNMFKVKGPKHSKGGVRLGDSEVEGGEIIKLTSDGAKILSDSKSKLGYSPANNVKNGRGNGMDFNRQFMKQEKYKTKGKTKKFQTGGIDPITKLKLFNTPNINTKSFDSYGFDNSARYSLNTKNNPTIPVNSISRGTTRSDLQNKILPVNNLTPNASVKGTTTNADLSNLPMYIDNVGNAILAANTPKVPSPTLAPTSRFKTSYNANPELDAIRSNERSSLNTINNSLVDSNVAAVLASKIGNQSTQARNKVLANKQNTETQLYNQGARSDIYTKLQNNRLINDNAKLNMQRQLGISGSISENLGNAARDSIHNLDTKRRSKLDQDRLQLEMLKDTEGNLDRTIMLTDNFDNIILNNYDQLLKANLPEKTIKAITNKYNQLMQSQNR